MIAPSPEPTRNSLPLHLPFNACPGRPALEVNPIAKAHGMFCAEEEIRLNTQSSSQWDGLCESILFCGCSRGSDAR